MKSVKDITLFINKKSICPAGITQDQFAMILAERFNDILGAYYRQYGSIHCICVHVDILTDDQCHKMGWSQKKALTGKTALESSFRFIRESISRYGLAVSYSNLVSTNTLEDQIASSIREVYELLIRCWAHIYEKHAQDCQSLFPQNRIDPNVEKTMKRSSLDTHLLRLYIVWLVHFIYTQNLYSGQPFEVFNHLATQFDIKIPLITPSAGNQSPSQKTNNNKARSQQQQPLPQNQQPSPHNQQPLPQNQQPPPRSCSQKMCRTCGLFK